MSHTHQWLNHALAESKSRRAVEACVDVGLQHGLDLAAMVDVDPELQKFHIIRPIFAYHEWIQIHSSSCSNGPLYIASPAFNCDNTTGFFRIHLDFQRTCSISKSHIPRGAILASLLVSCKSYCRLHVEEVSWKRGRLTSKHAACTDNTCMMIYTNGQEGPLWPTLH